MTADEIARLQIGIHPALMASPVAYQLINAAELAVKARKSVSKNQQFNPLVSLVDDRITPAGDNITPLE